jgi:Ca-activated chloride channel homolog
MIQRLVLGKQMIRSYSRVIWVCLAAGWILYAYISLPVDSSGNRSLLSLVLTADQQGQWYMKHRSYKQAAAAFTNTGLKAAALYRNGQFQDAALLFSANASAVSRFNQGTALIMSGRYEEAIKIFEQALEINPDLEPARINLEIATIRKEKNLPPEEDHGGTGGMLGADEIVFSDRKFSSDQGENEPVEGGASMGDEQMRALWLRRLESSPKDFFKVKFAYQNARQKNQGEQ